MRMKYLGFTKNQKFESKKKDFDWNEQEVEIIEFKDDNNKNEDKEDNKNDSKNN